MTTSDALRRDFVGVTTELSLLTPEAAERLQHESSLGSVSATQLALREGLLTAEQVEIVDTLLAPGEAIPGYEILSLIGSGGMGAVFRARQLNLNRVVALKTVLLSRGVGLGSLSRFEQEAVALARLLHPNIVSAYDFGKSHGRLYLALEYVEGEDAEKFVQRRGHLDEALVWNLIRQAAAGLSHAKAHGIVHRDIKPANLLLVAPPAGYPLPKGVPLVKIADFGLALLTADADRTRLTSEGTAVGSPNYMAPEQITASEIDHRADIYALGATAYHFLAGRAPFAGLQLAGVFGQKLAGGPQPLRELAPTLCDESYDLVARLMATKLEDRISDYDELLSRLERWTLQLGERAAEAERFAADPTMPVITPSSATLPETPAAPKSRRKWWIAVAGVVLLAAVGLGVWRPWVKTASGPVGAFYQADKYGTEYAQFNGESLKGWKVQGEWLPDKDDEGAIVLRGRGVAERRLDFSRTVHEGPPIFPGYRVTLLVRMHQAKAVRIAFDLADTGTRKPHEVILEAGRLTVAPSAGKPQASVPPEERIAVQIQLVRYSRGWLVLLNGESLCELPALSAAPKPDEPTTDRLRLQVDGGPAWFSDISVSPAR